MDWQAEQRKQVGMEARAVAKCLVTGVDEEAADEDAGAGAEEGGGAAASAPGQAEDTPEAHARLLRELLALDALAPAEVVDVGDAAATPAESKDGKKEEEEEDKEAKGDDSTEGAANVIGTVDDRWASIASFKPSSCGLALLPESLSLLTGLQQLWAHDNELTCLPQSLPSSVTELYLCLLYTSPSPRDS